MRQDITTALFKQQAIKSNSMPKLESAPQQKIRFLMCHICGRNFGTASLAIHQKTCSHKHQTKVSSVNSNNSFNEPSMTAQGDVKLESAYAAMMRGDVSVDEYNQLSRSIYEETAVERGSKQECHNCGRKFSRVEGLQKHRVLCERDQNGGGVFARKSLPPASASVSSSISSSHSLTSLKSGSPPPILQQSKGSRINSSTSLPSVTPQTHKSKIDRPISSETMQKTPIASAVSSSRARKSTPLGTRANFCTDCGSNFTNMPNASMWKYCPQCGYQRVEF